MNEVLKQVLEDEQVRKLCDKIEQALSSQERVTSDNVRNVLTQLIGELPEEVKNVLLKYVQDFNCLRELVQFLNSNDVNSCVHQYFLYAHIDKFLQKVPEDIVNSMRALCEDTTVVNARKFVDSTFDLYVNMCVRLFMKKLTFEEELWLSVLAQLLSLSTLILNACSSEDTSCRQLLNCLRWRVCCVVNELVKEEQ